MRPNEITPVLTQPSVEKSNMSRDIGGLIERFLEKVGRGREVAPL